MPLPESKTPWPPPGQEQPVQNRAEWSAWWGGDPAALTAVYNGSLGTEEQSWVQRGGLVGAFQRMFWGQPTPAGEQRTKLHVPLAAEIPQVSADLLFGAPPAITVEDKATQEAINRLMGEDVHVQLYDGAESCSALGHSFMRVVIDREVDPKAPILSMIDADFAWPVFRYGRLAECMFLSEWIEGGGAYWRHLQLHSVRGGFGMVEHALYVGDFHSLGTRVPLAAHPHTQIMDGDIVQLDDGRQGVMTGLKRLDVVAVPNARTRTWRHLPQSKDLGRADISGVEPILDALDDTWSSWMRDLRHGRSRLHVPNQYLRSNGPGKGAIADIDRELYVGLNTMVDAAGGALQINAQQFAIRFAEHEATATAATRAAVSGAGYSPQTFGLSDTTALTAMESWNQQIRTQNTRNAKVRRWRIGVRQLTSLMIEADRTHFGGKGNPDAVPAVLFQASVSDSAKARAETVSLLAAAKAASTETLIRMTHPDWDDAQVLAEVEKIKDMEPVPVSPMAAAFGGDSEDGDPDAEPADDDAEDEPFGQ